MNAKRKTEPKPTYLKSALLAVGAWTAVCVAVGLSLALNNSALGYGLAVPLLLVVAPAMHILGIRLATQGIGRGFGRFAGFVTLLLHAALISLGFIAGLVALVAEPV